MHDPSALLRQTALPLIAVVFALGLLAIAVFRIRNWMRENDDPAESFGELLSEYREMNQRGELSDEEYRIIKSRMVPRIGGIASRREPASPPGGPTAPGELDKDCRTG